MTQPAPLTDEQLNDIDARADAATPGPWSVDSSIPYGHRVGSSDEADWVAWAGEHGETGSEADAAFIAAVNPTVAKALLAEVRRQRDEVARLRTDAAADLLPAWEAMYEPGNVSDYLIGYANSEAAAKGAAEAWMRSEAEVTGRLEWVPQNPLDGYDREFELVERHDDGVDTGPGICVRHATPKPSTASVPSSRAPEAPTPHTGRETAADGRTEAATSAAKPTR